MLEQFESDRLAKLANRLGALGDPLRLQLLQAVSDGERTVGELVDLVGTTQPNISRHLARLHQAGWIERRRDGNHVLVRLAQQVDCDLCERICALLRPDGASPAGEERI